MKLTAVELHPHGGTDTIELSFRDPQRLGSFNAKNILGLDADAITARFYASGFYALSIEKRQVVIRIGLNPNFSLNETYNSLRDDIYAVITSSRTGMVHLHLKNGDDIVAAVNGFVSKVEAPLFEKTQEVVVTIDDVDGILRAVDLVEVDLTGLTPAETEITDLLSTAPHGFSFELEFSAAKAAIEITDPGDSTWSFEVTPAGGFLTGDILHFCSEQNEKVLYIERGPSTIHLADKITPGSVWPLIFPRRVNTFAVATSADIAWQSIEYYPAYWGV